MTAKTAAQTHVALVWLAYVQRFGLLHRLATRLEFLEAEPWCARFHGAHSRGGRREVGYPNIRLGPRDLAPMRVNRLVLLLDAVPERVLERGTEADLLFYVIRLNRMRRAWDAAHLCDAHGLGAACCHPGHLAWEAHADNVRSGVARKRARDAERKAAEYLAEARL